MNICYNNLEPPSLVEPTNVLNIPADSATLTYCQLHSVIMIIIIYQSKYSMPDDRKNRIKFKVTIIIIIVKSSLMPQSTVTVFL